MHGRCLLMTTPSTLFSPMVLCRSGQSPGNPLNGLWKKNLEAGLVEGVCKACSTKLGTFEAAKEQGLTLLDDMSGHPSMAAYRDNGYEIITF
jgi:hypothetical protein